MRYAVVSAAVFGSAIFMAPSSLLASNSSQNISSIFNTSDTVQLADAAPAKRAQPRQQPVAKLAAAAQTPAPLIVAVGDGDTLSKLALDNNSTVQRLFDANSDIADPNLIDIGQQIRVPSANEQLTERPMPTPAAVVTQSVQAVAAATVKPTTSSVAAPSVAGGSVWDQLAMCESGGNWAINTGNGFYGGLQFTLATWQGLGGTGLPNQASREEQIMRAQALQARSGWGQWPACTAKMGLL